MAPHLIQFAQMLSSKDIAEIFKYHITTSYKLQEGLAVNIHEHLVDSLTNMDYSMNLDKCMRRVQ